MFLTKAECDYYDGIDTFNVCYPVRYLLNNINNGGKGRPCPHLVDDDASKLLTISGLAYLRNKWAMRICDMYATSDEKIPCYRKRNMVDTGKSNTIVVKDDFEEFWNCNQASDIVEAAILYHAAYKMHHSSPSEWIKYQYVSQAATNCLKNKWALKEASQFGDYFDEFHLRFAENLDFPMLVTSYIAFLPYSWLLNAEKNEKTTIGQGENATDQFWLRGTATRKSDGKLIFSPFDHPEIKINIACSYPNEDYKGVNPLDKDIVDKLCFIKATYAGQRNDNTVILHVWDDDAENGAGEIILSIYDMCRLVADVE